MCHKRNSNLFCLEAKVTKAFEKVLGNRNFGHREPVLLKDITYTLQPVLIIYKHGNTLLKIGPLIKEF